MSAWFTKQQDLVSPSAYRTSPDYLFQPDAWPESQPVSGAGRGSAWYVADDAGRFVLRHYRRGGLVGRVLSDQYLLASVANSRSFREFRLLDRLHCLGLPVPEPVAARYQRSGLTYRADLLTRRIEHSETLAAKLSREPMSTNSWVTLGALLRRFHKAGAYHADLNAHNILVVSDDGFHVIDFDRGRLQTPGRWCQSNLRRLQRSFAKVGQKSPSWHAGPNEWRFLLNGYQS